MRKPPEGPLVWHSQPADAEKYVSGFKPPRLGSVTKNESAAPADSYAPGYRLEQHRRVNSPASYKPEKRTTVSSSLMETDSKPRPGSPLIPTLGSTQPIPTLWGLSANQLPPRPLPPPSHRHPQPPALQDPSHHLLPEVTVDFTWANQAIRPVYWDCPQPQVAHRSLQGQKRVVVLSGAHPAGPVLELSPHQSPDHTLGNTSQPGTA